MQGRVLLQVTGNIGEGIGQNNLCTAELVISFNYLACIEVLRRNCLRFQVLAHQVGRTTLAKAKYQVAGSQGTLTK